MGLLNSFRDARRNADAAGQLYVSGVEQARNPAFFVSYAVPDTVDGRFDLIILHTMLLLRRLRRQGEQAADVSQELLNLMFADMDRNLREMGVGDLSVGKQVKKMAKAFYGRAEVWEAGLEDSDESLANVLHETIFRAGDIPLSAAQGLAAYVRATDQQLAAQPLETLLSGEVVFPQPQSQAPAG